MLSSRGKILKANTVTIDTENKILIDVLASDDSDMEYDDDDEAFLESDVQSKNIENNEEAIIENAAQKAENMINNAKREAESIISNAKDQAAKESKRIQDDSKAQGYQEGINKAKQEGDMIRMQAQTVLEDANRERLAMQESLEPEIVDLIINILNKLLNNAIQLNPLIIVNLIKQGLSSATITGDVAIHVSSHDFENVVDNKDMILTMTDGSVRLEIKKDLSLNPMDCIIETAYGNIDCSLGQQYESLRNNLVYILDTV